MQDSFTRTEAPIVLVGHSHVATAAVLSGETIEGGVAPADFSAALGAGRWLLNPGSVGQPRDGDPRAAWLRLDLVSGEARFRRIAYPVARTQAEIRERGCPIRSPSVWLTACSAALALAGCGGQEQAEPRSRDRGSSARSRTSSPN